MASFFRGYHTESAGTAIVEVIPAYQDMIPRIEQMAYTSAATAHTIYIMRACGVTTATQGSLSGATTVTLAKTDPGKATTGADETLAASDYLVWVDENGVFKADTVSSVSGSVVTLSTALGSDVVVGAKFWAFMELGRATHFQLKPAVSTTTRYENINVQAGIPDQQGVNFTRTGSGEPLLVVVNNATAAGSIDYISGNYMPASNQIVG